MYTTSVPSNHHLNRIQSSLNHNLFSLNPMKSHEIPIFVASTLTFPIKPLMQLRTHSGWLGSSSVSSLCYLSCGTSIRRVEWSKRAQDGADRCSHTQKSVQNLAWKMGMFERISFSHHIPIIFHKSNNGRIISKWISWWEYDGDFLRWPHTIQRLVIKWWGDSSHVFWGSPTSETPTIWLLNIAMEHNNV